MTDFALGFSSKLLLNIDKNAIEQTEEDTRGLVRDKDIWQNFSQLSSVLTLHSMQHIKISCTLYVIV
jgi:hypothetical protein